MCVLHVIGAGSLVTTPPAIDGVLTSCGETRLTCSHDNVEGGTTRWSISAMDPCAIIIGHDTDISYRCNEFSFEDITALSTANGSLNSTATVNPLPLDVSGSQMECRAGPLATSPSVGSVILCVVGKVIVQYVSAFLVHSYLPARDQFMA